MTDFWRALSAEYIKLRKTFIVWVVLLAPLILNGMFFLISLKVEALPDNYENAWAWLIPNLSMFWSLMMLPMVVALVVGLVNYYEHSASAWKHLFALPVSRRALIAAKLVVCHAIILTGSLLVWAFTLSSGWFVRMFRPGFGYESPAPVWDLLSRVMLQYLAAGLIMAILFFVAVRFANIGVTIGVGIGGTFIGMVNVTGWFQKTFPWKLASNTQAAVPHVPEIALALGCGGGLLVAALVIVLLARRDVIA